MRFHLVALPHTRTSNDFSACAYTGKILRFSRMMTSLGHEVIHYGAEGSEAVCSEHVTIISSAEQERWCGEADWVRAGTKINFDDPKAPYWRVTNMRAAGEIASRERRGDFVCLSAGVAQKPIADALGELHSLVVEPFVGYYGTFARFCVFESYTHQAAVYGKCADGRLYDAVIPNYYDPLELPFCDEKQDYLLFLARVTERKGIAIAVSVARAAGMKLRIAGQGVTCCGREDDLSIPAELRGKLICDGGYTVDIRGADVGYFGYADHKLKAELLGHARAILQPTIFTEPFGGCVVEAQMCGTPAITTDYAAFSETVEHGVTGYRCHTREQFVWAAQNVHKLNPVTIRDRAISLYSMERVGRMFEEYFNMLSGMWAEGWPQVKERENLDWLMPLGCRSPGVTGPACSTCGK